MTVPAVPDGRDGTVHVLMSVRRPRPTTNPYIIQLGASMPEDVRVIWFSWSRALLGRYDVLHVHWPEVVVRRAGRLAHAAALARFALVLLRLQVRGTPVVRTLHNTATHEGGSRPEGWLLRWCDRLTVHWILLNPETPVPVGARSSVILHGDYTQWFSGVDVPAAVPGRIVFFGLLRPYKGIDELVSAFTGFDEPGATLHVVGRPTTEDLRRSAEDAQRLDPRISCRLEHVDDAALAREVGEAQLVVLPYRDMHNSGALLLALSLGRPALVPSTPTTQGLAREVGSGWVMTYDPPLEAAELARALAECRGPAQHNGPDLSQRSWRTLAAQHAEVYRSVRRGHARAGRS